MCSRIGCCFTKRDSFIVNETQSGQNDGIKQNNGAVDENNFRQSLNPEVCVHTHILKFKQNKKFSDYFAKVPTLKIFDMSIIPKIFSIFTKYFNISEITLNLCNNSLNRKCSKHFRDYFSTVPTLKMFDISINPEVFSVFLKYFNISEKPLNGCNISLNRKFSKHLRTIFQQFQH